MARVAAGYDSRAWRLSRPGLKFFEVDHPATQADKRARAPAGGPTYVPVNLDIAVTPLCTAGCGAHHRTACPVHGRRTDDVPPRSCVGDLLTELAGLGGPGSQLAVDFGVDASANTPTERALITATRAIAVLGKEPLRFMLEPAPAAELPRSNRMDRPGDPYRARLERALSLRNWPINTSASKCIRCDGHTNLKARLSPGA